MSNPATGPRPRKWLTVAALAFAASPSLALKGMLSLARGRSMRGWHQLNLAASSHPAYYARWIEHAEPWVKAEWCADLPADAAPPRLACLILGDNPAQRDACIAALANALPNAIILPRCSDIRQSIDIAEDEKCDWLLPIRASDRLSPDMETILRVALAGDPPPIIFWDSDRIVEGQRCHPFIKPEWDNILLRDWDLLGGAALMAIREARGALEACPTMKADEHGITQLLLALLSKCADRLPRHIPLILSHHHSSPFLGGEARAALLAEHGMSRRYFDEIWPSVTIIVPTRDQAPMMETCIKSMEGMDYPGKVDLMIIDNDSSEPETKILFDRMERNKARVIPFPGEFNFAGMMNHAASRSEGEYLCFLNNDVEALDGNWLRHLVREAMAPEAGATGARLLYPDGAIQHVGVAIGIGGAAGHVEKGARPEDPWLANWHNATRRVSAVTAACMVVKRSKFLAVGGMDEQEFAVDFNDVDLCLKLEHHGRINIVVPEATLVHHESKSRGKTRSPTQRLRFERELAALRRRWNTVNYRDPWHSSLFRPEGERCLLRF